MKLWILYDTKFGNGKILAELLEKEFPEEWEINIGDVKEISPKTVVYDAPDVIVMSTGSTRVGGIRLLSL